jgi:ElaB/YqjD/DUF883 family membrane-anchored ribosome-binding protein
MEVQMTDLPPGDFSRVGNQAPKGSEDNRDKATESASETLSEVADAGKQAWEVGQMYGTQAKEQAQEVDGQLSEQIGRALQAITRQVQAEPLLGILIAGAIGYFLGIVRRR